MSVHVEPTVDMIQQGIKARLSTITALGSRAYATEPDQPTFPCAYPRLVDWTYDDTYDGTCIWHFDVWVLVGLEPGFNRAQTWLNPFLSPSGPNSIKVAIECDPSLGHTVAFARATGGGSYGRIDIGGVAGLGASVRLEVFT